MGALLQVPTLILLLLVPLSCPFEFQRLSHGPSVEDDAFTRIQRQRDNVCQEVPRRMLRQVLGSAYNEWYMSFETPVSLIPDSVKDNVHKRNDHHYYRTIVVNRPLLKEDTEIVLSDEPAWQVDYSEEHSHSLQERFSVAPHVNKREGEAKGRKRSGPVPDNVLDAIAQSGNINFKWHCDAPYIWKDLGQDYFPRYILSRDCKHYSCQGKRFHCEPLPFPLKVLRKREGVCAPGFNVHRDTLQIGSDQMPHSLMQMWVWELRAVSECCVCRYKW